MAKIFPTRATEMSFSGRKWPAGHVFETLGLDSMQNPRRDFIHLSQHTLHLRKCPVKFSIGITISCLAMFSLISSAVWLKPKVDVSQHISSLGHCEYKSHVVHKVIKWDLTGNLLTLSESVRMCNILPIGFVEDLHQSQKYIQNCAYFP